MNRQCQFFLIFFVLIFAFYGLYQINQKNIEIEIPNRISDSNIINDNRNKIIEIKNHESHEFNEKEVIYLSSCKNKVKKNNEKSIWTFLTDGEGYHESAVKLIKSIKAHTTVHDFDTLVLEIKEKPLPDTVKQSLISNGWQICQVDRIAPRDEANTFDRFRDQFTKLVLWNFTEYNSIYYCLCLHV